jgi:hypothetical protein
VVISRADLRPVCSNCALDHGDPSSIKPGPCFFPLANGAQRCFAMLLNNTCPLGTSPCTGPHSFAANGGSL